MILSLRSLRLSSPAVVAAALMVSSGCKQVSTWTGPSPLISSPADPFESPTTRSLETPDPELTPVPDLPAPGHSVPLDPPPAPPPPMPREARSVPIPSERVAERPTTRWNLKPINLLKRGFGGHSFDAEAEEPTTSQDADPGTVQTQYNGARSNLRPISAPPAMPKFDDNYTGPVITPGRSYTAGRDVPIENWPHTPQRSVSAYAPPAYPLAPRVPAVSPAFPSNPVLSTTPASVNPTPARLVPPPEREIPAMSAPASPSVPLLLPPDV